MEIKKTPVQIPLTWLHVWLLFAGIYGFAAGFLELTGREALYFCAISLLLLIPAAASWILIRKTKALWQFLLGGIAVCAVTYLAAKFFCSLFSVQAAAVIEAAAAANDGKNKFDNGISPAFLESLSGVMTGLMAAVIFLIRGYVRIRKGQLKKAAQELPAWGNILMSHFSCMRGGLQMIDGFSFKDVYGIGDLLQIMQCLRSEGGCPWDREQTHESIKKNLIEETYEVIEAINQQDKALLCEELGDVLMQVVFHAQMEAEEGSFTFENVADGVCKKLIERHPHVFGEVEVTGSEEVLRNWDDIKKRSKGQTRGCLCGTNNPQPISFHKKNPLFSS